MAAEMKEEGGFVKKGKGFHLISRPGSKTLLVFFSGTGKKNGNFDFWGAGQRSPENVLFVNDAKNWWYQNGIAGLGAGIEATLNSIYRFRDMVGADRIITVGASMGGYGAALYGALMDADALALSFDSLLRLPTSPSEKHMPPDAPVVYPDLLPIVEASSAHIKIYAGEMYTMDMIGAQRLAILPNVSVTTLRGVWHDTARRMQNLVGIDAMIDAMVANSSIPRAALEGEIPSPAALTALHEAHIEFMKADYKACIAAAKEAVKLAPLWEPPRFLLGRSLLMIRKPSNAVAYLGYVAAALPDYEDAQFYFAHALRVAKQPSAALDLFIKQAERWPTARVYYNLALAHEALGHSDNAIADMRRAVSFEPIYAHRLEEMVGRLS